MIDLVEQRNYDDLDHLTKILEKKVWAESSREKLVII